MANMMNTPLMNRTYSYHRQQSVFIGCGDAVACGSANSKTKERQCGEGGSLQSQSHRLESAERLHETCFAPELSMRDESLLWLRNHASIFQLFSHITTATIWN